MGLFKTLSCGFYTFTEKLMVAYENLSIGLIEPWLYASSQSEGIRCTFSYRFFFSLSQCSVFHNEGGFWSGVSQHCKTENHNVC